MLNKAFRKRTEGELWQIYLADRSNPQVQRKPYSDYLKRLNKPQKTESNKTSEELIEWANNIKQIDQAS